MRKTLVIASREYQAAVRTKSFLISLLILPLMMGGSILIQVLLKDRVDTAEKRFAVVDRTHDQAIYKALDDASRRRNAKEIFDPASGKQTRPVFTIERVAPAVDAAEQRFELSERVRHGDLFGFVEVGPDVLELPSVDPQARTDADRRRGRSVLVGVPERATVRYQSNSPTYEDFPEWLQVVITNAVQEVRYGRLGLPRDKVQALLQPVPVANKGLSKKDPRTGTVEEAPDENRIASFLMPGGLMMLMFMVIMVGATPLMQGVVEEKMQRIAEVLLGSVRPFELMMGKLLGMVAVSLTLTAVYLGGAYWAAYRYGLSDFLSAPVITWFLVFQTLAVLMYGSLFIAVGAACTDLRETQSMMWPVMLVAMAPLFVWTNVVREPNSAFSTGVSFFPFATPTLMIIRQTVPPGVPWWQPVVGVCLVLATTVLCVYAAGRIFRVGILMQGKGAQVSELVRWVVRG